MKLTYFAALTLLSVQAASPQDAVPPAADTVFVALPYSELANKPLPRWNGALFRAMIDSKNGATESMIVYQPTGKIVDLDLKAILPAHLVVHDSVWNAGTTVIAASLAQKDGAIAHGLLFFDSFGRLSLFARTNPYIPRHLAFSPSSELWVFGQPGVEPGSSTPDLDAFRRYRADGTFISSQTPFSSLGISRLTRFVRQGSGPALLVSADRVMLVLARANLQYFELSHDGTLLSNTQLSKGFPADKAELKHLVLRPDNRLVGYFVGSKDFSHRQWASNEQGWVETPPMRGRPLGFVGERSLVATQDGGTWLVSWSEAWKAGGPGK